MGCGLAGQSRRWWARARHWLEMTDSIASPKPRKYEGSNESDWMIYPAAGGPGTVRMIDDERASLYLCRTHEPWGWLPPHSLGEEMLEPTRVYSLDCLALLRAGSDGPPLDVHALCHVTGGGLAANLERVLPSDVDAELDRTTWTPQPTSSSASAPRT